MPYLALSQKHLARLNHNWFWGLLVDTNSSYTLYSSALLLRNDPQLRQSMERAIEKINKKPWLIRSLYWLFNINNYRLHYYNLQGFWSLDLFQTGQKMMDAEQLRELKIDRLAAFIIPNGSPFALQLPPYAKASLTWFNHHIRAYLSDLNQINTLPETKSAPHSEALDSPIATPPLFIKAEAVKVKHPSFLFDELEIMKQDLGSLENRIAEVSSGMKENRVAMEQNRVAMEQNRVAMEQNRVAMERISVVNKQQHELATEIREQTASLLALMTGLSEQLSMIAAARNLVPRPLLIEDIKVHSASSDGTHSIDTERNPHEFFSSVPTSTTKKMKETENEHLIPGHYEPNSCKDSTEIPTV